MSSYVGIHTQVSKNNRKSVLYLIAFPLLIFIPAWVLIFVMRITDESNLNKEMALEESWYIFLSVAPIIGIVIGIWFLIAYLGHSSMIKAATHSHTLDRKEDPRVYNLTENLCMSVGMKMPKLQIIESPVLNAFASGLNESSYTVTLTRGIIDKLDDRELEGVIAHELMHIRNKDVRLLVISIIFVGIFSLLTSILWRSFIYGGHRRSSKDSKGNGAIMLVALVLVVISYLLSMMFKFGLSRKREYMADAGAADMTKNPRALASALRKISGNHDLEFVNDEMKQMFIANNVKPKEGSFSISGLFKTHPPIEKRIEVLENF